MTPREALNALAPEIDWDKVPSSDVAEFLRNIAASRKFDKYAKGKK